MNKSWNKTLRFAAAGLTLGLVLGSDAALARSREHVREYRPRVTQPMFDGIRDRVEARRSAPRRWAMMPLPSERFACLFPRLFSGCPDLHDPFGRGSGRPGYRESRRRAQIRRGQ